MNLNRSQFHQLKLQQAKELHEQLSRTDLTGNMIATIMDASIEGCSDAYFNGDEVAGDKLVAVNVRATELLSSSPAARSAAVFLTAQNAEVAA